MSIFSTYLNEVFAEKTETFKSVEEVVDRIIEETGNKKDALKMVKDLERKNSFVKKNKKEIEKLINQIPNNMFSESSEEYFGADIVNDDEEDEDSWDDVEEYYDDEDEFFDDDEDDWGDEDEMNEGVRRVRVVRGNKVMIKKRSTRPGYKMVGGKERRMGASERRARMIAQRKAARKRKGMKSKIQRKRKISMRKRKVFSR